MEARSRNVARVESRTVEEQWLSKISFAAKSALQQLHLQAKLLDASLTPNSAWLRFAGSSNLTVDQVLKKRSGLLTTFGLNVISVRPEPGAVVIAVEREIREFIDIRHVWSRWEPRTEWWGNQDLLVGTREHDGSLLFLSPGHEDRTQTALAKSANRNIG